MEEYYWIVLSTMEIRHIADNAEIALQFLRQQVICIVMLLTLVRVPLPC